MRHDAGSLGQFYRRKVKQLGAKRALVALARKLLIVAWRMLQTGEPYRAWKPALARRKEQTLRRLLGQLAAIGGPYNFGAPVPLAGRRAGGAGGAARGVRAVPGGQPRV